MICAIPVWGEIAPRVIVVPSKPTVAVGAPAWGLPPPPPPPLLVLPPRHPAKASETVMTTAKIAILGRADVVLVMLPPPRTPSTIWQNLPRRDRFVSAVTARTARNGSTPGPVRTMP